MGHGWGRRRGGEGGRKGHWPATRRAKDEGGQGGGPRVKGRPTQCGRRGNRQQSGFLGQRRLPAQGVMMGGGGRAHRSQELSHCEFFNQVR